MLIKEAKLILSKKGGGDKLQRKKLEIKKKWKKKMIKHFYFLREGEKIE